MPQEGGQDQALLTRILLHENPYECQRAASQQLPAPTSYSMSVCSTFGRFSRDASCWAKVDFPAPPVS